MGLNYKEAGVDLDKEEKTIEALAKKAIFSRKDSYKKIDTKNHYAGIIELGKEKLAMSTDGVGTKLLVAEEMGIYESIAIDCIAMNVNDVLSVGAEPIGFVDYLAFEEPKEEISQQIGEGLRKGAEKANVNLLGGETATLTEVINGFDLAGCSIGITDKLILGEEIETGDNIVGIKSNGIHSNGLTLARESIKNSKYNYRDSFNQKNTIGEELLKPTEIYVKPILELLKETEIHGLAHITGGGLKNLSRLGKFKYSIDNPIKPQEIFEFIQEIGSITTEEMFNVFNMGTGYCLITPEESSGDIVDSLKEIGYTSKVIGEVKKGSDVIIRRNDKKIVL